MKRITLILAIITGLAYTTQAQRSNQKWFRYGIGPRIDFLTGNYQQCYGLSFEGFLQTRFSMEVYVATNTDDAYRLGVLAKYVAPIPDVPAMLRWYTGGGITAGTQKTTPGYAGASFVLGIGYTFKNAPVNLSVDVHPTINLYRNTANISDQAIVINSFEPALLGIVGRYIIE